MKRFRFRLEKVLHFRTLVREEKRRELMLRNLKLQEARQLLEVLIQMALSNTIAQGRIMRVEEVVLAGLFAERIKVQIEQQRQEVVAAEEEVRKAMDAYIEASKEARSLEMLKERKLQEYTEYFHKEEEKFLDELSVQSRAVKPLA